MSSTTETKPVETTEKKEESGVTKLEIFCLGVISGLVVALALGGRSRC